MPDSHARYCHNHRPRDLHVKCRACGGRALAAKLSEQGLAEHHVGDCRVAWDTADWLVSCEECPLRDAGLPYSDLPPPYYEVAARGVRLWAWNRNHLTMLLDLLENRSVEDHPYAWFAAYARKDWIVKKARGHLARAIRKQWPDVGAAV